MHTFGDDFDLSDLVAGLDIGEDQFEDSTFDDRNFENGKRPDAEELDGSVRALELEDSDANGDEDVVLQLEDESVLSLQDDPRHSRGKCCNILSKLEHIQNSDEKYINCLIMKTIDFLFHSRYRFNGDADRTQSTQKYHGVDVP